MRHTFFAALLLGLILPIVAQRADPQRTSHFRVRAIDRVVTNAQGLKEPAHVRGMLGWVAVYRGDLCLVEYVAAKYDDFAPLRRDIAAAAAAGEARLKAFDKHLPHRDALLPAARVLGFTDAELDKLAVRVP
jgi:hypothetical protein